MYDEGHDDILVERLDDAPDDGRLTRADLAREQHESPVAPDPVE